jgi:maleamate amidohydrolase
MTPAMQPSWSTLLSGEELQVMQRYARVRSESLEMRRPALLVVDAVESFLGPDLPVHQAQDAAVTACGEFAWQAVPHIRHLLDVWRLRRLPIAYSTILRLPGPEGTGAQSREGSLRADVIPPPIAPEGDDAVFPKTRPSMFFGTPLLLWLRRQGADGVVLTGGSTSGCVRASAVDAYSNGFEAVVVEDGCFDRIRSAHERTLLDLSFKYARVMTAADVVASEALAPGAAPEQ